MFFERSTDKPYRKIRMATQAMPSKGAAVALAEPLDCLRYAARQPTMDQRGRVVGYELLFRAGPEAAFRGDADLGRVR
jgi:hypothetical protein